MVLPKCSKKGDSPPPSQFSPFVSNPLSPQQLVGQARLIRTPAKAFRGMPLFHVWLLSSWMGCKPQGTRQSDRWCVHSLIGELQNPIWRVGESNSCLLRSWGGPVCVGEPPECFDFHLSIFLVLCLLPQAPRPLPPPCFLVRSLVARSWLCVEMPQAFGSSVSDLPLLFLAVVVSLGATPPGWPAPALRPTTRAASSGAPPPPPPNRISVSPSSSPLRRHAAPPEAR